MTQPRNSSGLIPQCMGNKESGILPLSPTQLKPHLQSCLQLPSTGRTWGCWSESSGDTNMIRGMEQFWYEERLRELELLSLENRRLQVM